MLFLFLNLWHASIQIIANTCKGLNSQMEQATMLLNGTIEQPLQETWCLREFMNDRYLKAKIMFTCKITSTTSKMRTSISGKAHAFWERNVWIAGDCFVTYFSIISCITTTDDCHNYSQNVRSTFDDTFENHAI